MKNSMLFASVSLFLLFSTLGYAADNVGQTIATGVGRGLVNIVTSPAEIGHHIVYDTAKINVPGVLTGLGKGLVFMLGRTVAGFSDFITLGFIPPEYSLYKSMYMQEYVWDEQWLPPPETTSASPATSATLEPVAQETEQPINQTIVPDPAVKPIPVSETTQAEKNLKAMENIYPDR